MVKLIHILLLLSCLAAEAQQYRLRRMARLAAAPCVPTPISISEIGLIDVTSNQSIYTNTAPITPTAGSLLVAGFITSDTISPAAHVITSLHGTWIQANTVVHDTVGTPLHRTSLWYCTNAAATASVISNNIADAATGCEAVFLQVLNASTNFASIIVQTVTNSADASSPAITMAALAGGGTNTVIAILGNDANTFGGTPETDWVEEFDDGYNTPSTGLYATWRTNCLDNTVAVTASSDWGGIAIEIAALPCGTPGGGGGGPDTFYYSFGQSNPTEPSFWGADQFFAVPVTATSGGTVTKIGWKTASDLGSDAHLRIGLWWNNAGTWTLADCGIITVPAGMTPAAWLDLTLSSPYTIASSETVRISCISDDGSGNIHRYRTVAETGGYKVVRTYADGCLSTEPTWGGSDESDNGARIYVD